MKCPCPTPPGIPDIPDFDCEFKMDQIVRLMFQLIQPGNASTFTAVAGGGLEDIAAIDAGRALVATDPARLVLTPYFGGMVIPPSEAQTEGGNDNSTPFGVAIDLGETSVTVNGLFRNIPPAVKRALDAYRCLSQSAFGAPRIGAYFINKEGEIFHNLNTGGLPVGIPLYNFRTSSRGSEGFNQADKVNFGFGLQSNWDNNLVKTIPNYGLVELT